MAGASLTQASSLSCPHGGTVTIVAAGRAGASGAKLATTADQFIIAGCPFMLPTPVPTPSPCVSVQWILGSVRMTAGGAQPLDQGSAGMCLSAAGIPQGPVVIQNTQPLAQGQ